LLSARACDLASPSEGVQRSTREGSTQHSKELSARRSSAPGARRRLTRTAQHSVLDGTPPTTQDTPARMHASTQVCGAWWAFTPPLFSRHRARLRVFGFRCGSCGGCSAMDAGRGCEWWTMGGSSQQHAGISTLSTSPAASFPLNSHSLALLLLLLLLSTPLSTPSEEEEEEEEEEEKKEEELGQKRSRTHSHHHCPPPVGGWSDTRSTWRPATSASTSPVNRSPRFRSGLRVNLRCCVWVARLDRCNFGLMM
jgi:hypothetical protein